MVNEDDEKVEGRRNVKITEDDFIGVPFLKVFAVHAKCYFRTQAAFGSAFPPWGPVEHLDFVMKLLTDAANEPTDNEAKDAFLDLIADLSNSNTDLFEKLCTFVSYSLLASFRFDLGLICSLGNVWEGAIDQHTYHKSETHSCYVLFHSWSFL